MAMVMLLVDGAGDEVAISAAMADDLARLGITNVAICRDRETVGIVLEGWAFDATTVDAAARSLIQAPHVGRVLLPVIRIAVSDGHERDPALTARPHEKGGQDAVARP
jgi:hypothetical protein